MPDLKIAWDYPANAGNIGFKVYKKNADGTKTTLATVTHSDPPTEAAPVTLTNQPLGQVTIEVTATSLSGESPASEDLVATLTLPAPTNVRVV